MIIVNKVYYSYICRCLPPDRIWHKVNDPPVGLKWGSNPAGLCWLSTRLVQCGPDEPSWSWTQIWVQARMPAYSLNWTARSQCYTRGTKVSILQLAPPEGGLAEAGGLSAANLPLISTTHQARMPDGPAKAREGIYSSMSYIYQKFLERYSFSELVYWGYWVIFYNNIPFLTGFLTNFL